MGNIYFNLNKYVNINEMIYFFIDVVRDNNLIQNQYFEGNLNDGFFRKFVVNFLKRINYI